MQSDPRQEWERLTHLYAEMSDEELLELSGEFGNLTETAQQVLRDEMRKRRLPETAAKQTETSGNRQGSSMWSTSAGVLETGRDEALATEDRRPREYTWKVLLRECDSQEQASQMAEMLSGAGIESWIETSRNSWDDDGPRVLVAEDQLDEAQEIAARTIPQEIVAESQQTEEDFEPPRCPQCGAEDPLLLGVNPGNTWRCENCGAQWTDVTSVENAVRNPAG